MQLNRIIKQKVKLMNSEGAFLGALGFSLPTIKRDDILTMAVSNKALYYNEAFVEKLTDDELRGVLSHEYFHVALEHCTQDRSKGFNQRKANIAMDYVINSIISTRPYYGVLPKGCLINSKYTENMSFEEVYYQLGNTDEDTLDDHSLFGEPTEEDRQALADKLKAAASFAGSKTPSMFSSLLSNASTSSSYNWRSVLRKAIPISIARDKSFTRPSRRNPVSRIINPGNVRDEKFELGIAIDTSGSICANTLAKFFGELKAILKAVPKLKLHLWCFDTSVCSYQVFDENTLKDVNKYQPAGGGGTDFQVNWDFMKQNKIKPSSFIMFTDGEPYRGWGDSAYCPTIFCIHNTHHKPSPLFGKAIYID